MLLKRPEDNITFGGKLAADPPEVVPDFVTGRNNIVLKCKMSERRKKFLNDQI